MFTVIPMGIFLMLKCCLVFVFVFFFFIKCTFVLWQNKNVCPFLLPGTLLPLSLSLYLFLSISTFSAYVFVMLIVKVILSV